MAFFPPAGTAGASLPGSRDGPGGTPFKAVVDKRLQHLSRLFSRYGEFSYGLVEVKGAGKGTKEPLG